MAGRQDAFQKNTVHRTQKVHTNVGTRRTERVIYRSRPHLGAADPDIDDVGDSVAAASAPTSASHVFSELEHAAAFAFDLLGTRTRRRERTKGRMQSRTSLRFVHDFARHHAAMYAENIALRSEGDQAFKVVAAHALTGNIETNAAGADFGCFARAAQKRQQFDEMIGHRSIYQKRAFSL